MSDHASFCIGLILFLGMVVLASFVVHTFKKEERNKKPEEYATVYGKLLAEEDPKGFFTIPDVRKNEQER